jgi:VanZ family protein
MFTPGRSAMFQDVLLDTAGAVTGVLLVLLFIGIKKLRGKKI